MPYDYRKMNGAGFINKCVLEPKPLKSGYVTKDGMYAVFPYKNKYILVYNGQQIKTYRKIETAKKAIDHFIKHSPPNIK